MESRLKSKVNKKPTTTFLDSAGRDAVVDLFAEDTEDVLTARTARHAALRVDNHGTSTRLAGAVQDVGHGL